MSDKPLKTILYAEDEADIRAIAQIALESIGGFKVEYCKNGKEVMEMLKHFTPDLLLLDVMMPEMDGPSVLNEVRKKSEYSAIPVIFITAKIQSNEIDNYKAMGVLDVITKPFDPMKLADTIKKIWRENTVSKMI